MTDRPQPFTTINAPAQVAPLHPVRRALIEAAIKLNALQPTKIVGEPDMSDAKALQQDLDAIAAIVDPIILAIGHYASSNFGRIDMGLFTDQLRGALDGNATFEIESAARLMEDYRPDGEAELAFEFRRA